MSASEFDQLFDGDTDVSDHLELKSAKVRYPTQRISIDFPKDILASLDEEAAKIGVTRTSLIKIWVAQNLHGSLLSNH